MKHLKQEFDKLSVKDVIMLLLAIVSMSAGIALLFMGMIIEPKGEIHSSVIYSFGMICVFVASLLGISMRYQSELVHFKNEVGRILTGLNINQEEKCVEPEA